jgi:hypothetical protein
LTVFCPAFILFVQGISAGLFYEKETHMKRNGRRSISWILILALAVAILMAREKPIKTDASSGGFMDASVEFTDTNDGYLSAYSYTDSNSRKGYSSDCMLVRYHDRAGNETGRRIIDIASKGFDGRNGLFRVTVEKVDVVSNPPANTVSAVLDQCVILENGSGKGTYFAFNGPVGLTEREKNQFSKYNDGTAYMTADELNRILEKVHRFIPDWNPVNHRYECFNYKINIPESEYKKNVRLTVNAGRGISGTYGTGEYELGSSPVYGGYASFGFNAPSQGTVSSISEDTTVTVDGSPWTHTITYDLGGGEGTFPDQNVTYGNLEKLHGDVPKRPGYSFSCWIIDKVNSPTMNTDVKAGETLSPLDEWRHAQDGGSVTLKAVWELNSYTLTYHANNGKNEADIKENIIYCDAGAGSDSRYKGVLKADQCGFSAPMSCDGKTPKTFTGWSMRSDAKKPHENGADPGDVEISRHADESGVKMLSELIDASSLTYQGGNIDLYAIWDDVPVFDEPKNLYFSSEKAESGITRDDIGSALAGSAGAVRDHEDGEAFIFRADIEASSTGEPLPEDTIAVLDFDPDDFRNIEGAGTISVCLRATDWAGNHADRYIKVHITSPDPNGYDKDRSVKKGLIDVRLIDRKNYEKGDPKNGGLKKNSVWYKDKSCRDLLLSVFKKIGK